MAFDKINLPQGGEKITMGAHGRLQVPEQPIVVFIEGDGAGAEIWGAARRIIDAAVERAYGGKRKIAWMEAYAGERAREIYDLCEDELLPQETFEALSQYLIAVSGLLAAPTEVILRQKHGLHVCLRQADGDGMPGACINYLSGHAVFEAVHGSELKHAEESTVNPCAMALAGEMMLRYIGWTEAAVLVLRAVHGVIADKTASYDFNRLVEGAAKLTTSGFVDVVMAQMDVDSASAEATDQYDQLAARFKELFDAGAEKSAEFAHVAMEKARQQLTSAGAFSEEQGNNLKSFLERDLAQLADMVRQEARLKLNPTRVGVGALSSLFSLLNAAGSALASAAERTEKAISCRSGEITSAGTLTCMACGFEAHFKKTGRVPPCPKCHATEFRKSY
jgi:hypothetical protein